MLILVIGIAFAITMAAIYLSPSNPAPEKSAVMEKIERQREQDRRDLETLKKAADLIDRNR